MNKSMLVGSVLGAAVVTAGGAFAGFQLLDREPAFAEVLDVQPMTETVKTSREACHDVEVTHTQQPKDQHKVTGTVIGAVVGGVLGNQVGSGRGRKVATAAGAAAGGYAGNRVQDKMQQGNTFTTTEQRCETVYDLMRSRSASTCAIDWAMKRPRCRWIIILASAFPWRMVSWCSRSRQTNRSNTRKEHPWFSDYTRAGEPILMFACLGMRHEDSRTKRL